MKRRLQRLIAAIAVAWRWWNGLPNENQNSRRRRIKQAEKMTRKVNR